MNKDIILVGNGTSIMDHMRGSIIDAFGIIVRFNNFIVEGFEQYAGSRTDVWIRHPWVTEERDVPIKFVKVTNGRTNPPENFLRSDDKLLPDDGQRMLEAKYKPQIDLKYSTGLAALSHYVIHYPVVHIVGFSNSQQHGNTLHYYQDNAILCQGHDYKLERQIIEDFIIAGRCREL